MGNESLVKKGLDDPATTAQEEHSPMGGSRAACFIACPGSVSLSRGIPDPESEYAAEGTRAHELAAKCLETGQDAWECINEENKIDKDMADAVQIYLDDVRRFYETPGEENAWIEHGFSFPEVHKHFRGHVDFAKLIDIKSGPALRLWDYKHGKGIVVEVENNAQLKYYAVGLILQIKKELDINVNKVFFKIVQPRAFHPEGPVREASYTSEELIQWTKETLVPAMVTAETSEETNAGEHCRFCPCRLRQCPALDEHIEKVGRLTFFEEEGDLEKLERLSNERIAFCLALEPLFKILMKGIKTVAYQRLQAGQKIRGQKLVNGQVNRVWKEDAAKAAEEKFKAQAFKTKELLSPAQMEKLPGGEEFAAQYAYKPPAPLTMAPESDRRRAVNKDTKSLFKPVKEKH